MIFPSLLLIGVCCPVISPILSREVRRGFVCNRELLGWALETTEEYALNIFTKDMTKRPQDEEYQLKGDQGSWELVKWQQFAVTSDLEVLEEYEKFQNLFNQPEQPEVPEHSAHNHMIPLEEGKEPTCKRIYLMSEKELQALCDYVTD